METDDVQVMVFEIGGRSYAADASQVLRVGRAGATAFSAPALGTLSAGNRSLVFNGGDDKLAELKVDVVHGLRAARPTDLRRIPPIARAHPYVVGVWLEDEARTFLIDLDECLKFHQLN